MNANVHALSDREKQTLRLLLAGHDAKSIARHLDLSIHTVNERLRDCRRKLGVASSREAARALAEVELGENKISVPEMLGDNPVGHSEIGVADPPSAAPVPRHRYRAQALIWLSGGMLIMSLIIAAAVVASSLHRTAEMPSAPAKAAISDTAQSPAATAAGAWVLLLDRERWDDSWDAAGAIFRTQMPKAQWGTTIQPVRKPLGAVASRTFKNATRASSLPGAPPGDYEIVQFATAFATKSGAIETVVLAHEPGGWKVDGYFIR